jgi:hypothetical protein
MRAETVVLPRVLRFACARRDRDITQLDRAPKRTRGGVHTKHAFLDAVCDEPDQQGRLQPFALGQSHSQRAC